ncbi:MAG TPA: pyrroline-5-carboxylate reductase [Casimicrobiaceae bacterium]|nr:pyrroline-5-carboxylate reductase [Casimicrobiaceae bacterium]
MHTTFIGGGNMATALIGGMVARGASPSSFRVVEPIAEQRDRLAARFPGIVCSGALGRDDIVDAQVVVFAVKPQNMKDAARAAAPFIERAQVALTIAAGIRTGDVSRWLGGYARIVRAMPNTPALIGRGISGVYAMPGIVPQARAAATSVVEAAGEVVSCEHEDELDAVTGVSGSGPAYVFYFLEALDEAARSLGFDARRARQLAYATFSGAIELASRSSDSPAQLRANVTSKGGTTARAIESLEHAHVKESFIAAVRAAAERARELGDQLGKDP